MPGRKRRQKGSRVSNVTLLLVVFKRHHVSEVVNVSFWGRDPFNTLDLCSGTPFLSLSGIRLHSLLLSPNWKPISSPLHHDTDLSFYQSITSNACICSVCVFVVCVCVCSVCVVCVCVCAHVSVKTFTWNSKTAFILNRGRSRKFDLPFHSQLGNWNGVFFHYDVKDECTKIKSKNLLLLQCYCNISV